MASCKLVHSEVSHWIDLYVVDSSGLNMGPIWEWQYPVHGSHWSQENELPVSTTMTYIFDGVPRPTLIT